MQLTIPDPIYYTILPPMLNPYNFTCQILSSLVTTFPSFPIWPHPSSLLYVDNYTMHEAYYNI